MAASVTPRIADRSTLTVAYSGGRDSTALLHATAVQAQQAGLAVLALHVHHGLSVHADDWLRHCERQCVKWAAAGLPVRFQARRLVGRPAPAQSVEAWARERRYAALADMTREASADLLLLGQHRRDQAETLLLQALRGAGAAGLAGMPRLQWRDGICWARPWLDQPRELIDRYIAEHELDTIEDDSNADPRYARNRLRLTVWPSVLAAFPQAEASMAQSARWAQEALALQQEMAAHDLQMGGGPDGLDIAVIAALSPARASNALRAWIHAQTGQAAPASLIERLRHECFAAEQGAWPSAGGWLRLYRGRLCWVAEAAHAAPPPSQSVNLGFAGDHAQPDWNGVWRVTAVQQAGVSAVLLQDLTLGARSGGEQFQRSLKSAPRRLKKAYQAAGIPVWRREGPLLFAGDRLLFAPGLGLDARLLAAAGEPQFMIDWRPGSPQAKH